MILNYSDSFLREKIINHSPKSCLHGGTSDVVKQDSPTYLSSLVRSFIHSFNILLPEPIPAKDSTTGAKRIK